MKNIILVTSIIVCSIVHFPVIAFSETIDIVGSDTMATLMSTWTDNWHKQNPSISVNLAMNGSAHTPKALADKSVWLGAMSRRMTKREVQLVVDATGYKPVRIFVAVDAIAIITNSYNPVAGLSLFELDAMFSSSRKCGSPVVFNHWSQLVSSSPMVRLSIRPVRRDRNSGTYEYFRKSVMCDGLYSGLAKEVGTSREVVDYVANTPGAIGYIGIGYLNSSVRAVPISKSVDSPHYLPTLADITGRKYPLGRPLYIYARNSPDGLPEKVKSLLSFVVSEDGNEIVRREGFFPLPTKLAVHQLGMIAR